MVNAREECAGEQTKDRADFYRLEDNQEKWKAVKAGIWKRMF
jgi:hypothetical protein